MTLVSNKVFCCNVESCLRNVVALQKSYKGQLSLAGIFLILYIISDLKTLLFVFIVVAVIQPLVLKMANIFWNCKLQGGGGMCRGNLW